MYLVNIDKLWYLKVNFNKNISHFDLQIYKTCCGILSFLRNFHKKFEKFCSLGNSSFDVLKGVDSEKHIEKCNIFGHFSLKNT